MVTVTSDERETPVQRGFRYLTESLMVTVAARMHLPQIHTRGLYPRIFGAGESTADK